MIYLDLDGPMIDWTGGVYKLFGKSAPSIEQMLKNNGDLADDLGVKKSQIWARINKAGAKWWADLRPQPWAREFYNALSRVDEVVILTSPSHIPSAAMGKTQWIKEFFGGNFRNYILTSRKDLLAKSGDILIDDHDKNVDAFTQSGGIGVTFPRPWNKASKESVDATQSVYNKMHMIYPRFVTPGEEDDVDW